MTINGRQKDITGGDLLAVAENMEINKAKEIVAEVTDAVARWPEYAKEAGVSSEVAGYIGDVHAERRQSMADLQRK